MAHSRHPIQPLNYRSLFLLPLLLVGLSCSSRLPQQSSAPRVVGVVEFVGGNLTGPVAKLQLADWWNSKLKVAPPDAYDFLTNTNGQDRINVETCRQYTNAIHQGAYAPTSAGMVTEVGFVRAAATLRFMEQAKSSTQGLADDCLSRLPVSVVGWNGSDEHERMNRDTSNGLTLNDYARLRKLSRWKQAAHMLTFQTDAKSFAVEVLARGDWDGDGTEDALVAVTWHYREGSGFGYEVHVVRRSVSGSLLQLSRP